MEMQHILLLSFIRLRKMTDGAVFDQPDKRQEHTIFALLKSLFPDKSQNRGRHSCKARVTRTIHRLRLFSKLFTRISSLGNLNSDLAHIQKNRSDKSHCVNLA